LNLRCLVYLNPSLFDERTHSFDLRSDSGFILTYNVINEILKKYDWHFFILMPPEVKEKDYFIKPRHVTYVPYQYPLSAMESRFSLDPILIKDYFQFMRHDIDVVWSMIPGLMGGLHSTVNNKMRQAAIKFGYFNWVDSPNNQFPTTPIFILQQVNGILNSHFCGVNSQVMKDEILFSAKRYVNQETLEFIAEKLWIMPPGVTKKENVNFSDYDPNLIVFNHRFNKFTNFSGLLELVNEMFPGDKPFRIWVTDRSRKKRIKKPWIIYRNYPSFQDYVNQLSRVNFGVSTHVTYSMWSMSVLDLFSLGKPVLLPENLRVFKEMTYEGYPFFYSTKKEFMRKFKELLNRPFLEERKKIKEFTDQNFLWEFFADKLVEGVERFYSNPRKLKKTPEFVKDNIIEIVKKFGAVSKRELYLKNISSVGSRVSLAWPYVRRNLILSGIKDDTSRPDTVFYVGEKPPKILPEFEKVELRPEDSERFRLVEREVKLVPRPKSLLEVFS